MSTANSQFETTQFETTVLSDFYREEGMPQSFKKISPPLIYSADPSTNRRTPRRSYERLVGVMTEGKYSLRRASQISEGGMLIELPFEIQAGDLILVTFILPNALETIVGRAEILYKKDKVLNGVIKTGIKFLNLETSKRRAIRDFVSSKPTDDKPL